mgnify:FL=1
MANVNLVPLGSEQTLERNKGNRPYLKVILEGSEAGSVYEILWPRSSMTTATPDRSKILLNLTEEKSTLISDFFMANRNGIVFFCNEKGKLISG